MVVAQEAFARLATLRAERDDAAVQQALHALTRGAEDEGANLLALAVEAARAGATVGEMSDALERGPTREEAKEKRTQR